MFQFTPVLRRATYALRLMLLSLEVSIHARLATGDADILARKAPGNVSIHARLATGDTPGGKRVIVIMVSIHARLATGDPVVLDTLRHLHRFNSRPSCDGRRVLLRRVRHRLRFNSRPSCDGRPPQSRTTLTTRLFQFTPVLRRATRGRRDQDEVVRVSIHAHLATGDQANLEIGYAPSFNSRPSCDGRPKFAAR